MSRARTSSDDRMHVSDLHWSPNTSSRAEQRSMMLVRLVQAAHSTHGAAFTSLVNLKYKGIARLPDKVICEIVSQWHVYPIPTVEDREAYETAYEQRRQTLQALTLTSLAMRQTFLPYLWERIEVYDEMYVGDNRLPSAVYAQYQALIQNKAWGAAVLRRYAMALYKQLYAVTVVNPSLAQYVKFLDILVVDYMIDTSLSGLARCMAELSNLHTVQIQVQFVARKRRNFPERVFFNYFGQYTYPNIRILSTCAHASDIIYSCPGIVDLTPHRLGWRNPKYGISKVNPKFIAELGTCQAFDNIIQTNYFVHFRDLKNLRFITLLMAQLPTQQSLHWLMRRPNLQPLTICLGPLEGHPPIEDKEVDEFKGWVISIFPEEFVPELVLRWHSRRPLSQ